MPALLSSGTINAKTIKNTIPAIMSNIKGSSNRTMMSIRLNVVRFKLSDICTMTVSCELDSSATEIISTT